MSPASTSKEWPGIARTLTALDDERLVQLLALRPDLASPPPRDMTALAARAGAWPSARDCYLALDRAGQQVVEATCLLPQPTTRSAVAALLDVSADDADLDAALGRIVDRALAFISDGPDADQAEIRLLPALRQVDYPARLGPSLTTLLGTLTGPALEQMAVRLGLRPAKLKAQTLTSIVAHLSDPLEVRRLLERGPEGTIDLARRAAVNGPLVSVAQGLYGVTDRTTAGWMVNRGLLGIADYYTAVMPREPAVALRGGHTFPPECLRQPALDLSDVDPAAVDRVAAEQATRLVADVAAVLDQWSAEPPALLKGGGIGIREVRKAAKVTERNETEVARVIEFACAAGLARADVVAGVAGPTAAYDEWLAAESPARWAWLAGSWLEADLHVSLAGAIGTKEKPIPPLLMRAYERDAIGRRKLVSSVMTAVPSGQTATVTSVSELLDWTSPATWAGGPAMPATLVAWALAEQDLLGISALGALSTAGRAVLDRRPGDAAAALAALVPPAVAEFVVQADLTAVIAGEPAAAVRTELDLLGDVESKGAATVYRFTEGSIRRAFDAGRTAEDITAFFERHATRGVPQPLAYLVADIGRRFGNVRVGAVTSYLRSDDPALLQEVRQARGTARLKLRMIAPSVLVTAVDAATVVSTLQSAGYLPAAENADGTLLLSRPPAQRIGGRPATMRLAPPEPDYADIVAGLRRRPAPAPAPPRPSPVPSSIPSVMASLFAVRPTEIARDARAVRLLLEDACEYFWIVRLSYMTSNGHNAEVTLEPTEVDGRNLYASSIPDANGRRIALRTIEWVRVLTEAEEDLLL